VSEFLAEAPKATASEELDQGPYVSDRVGFESTTIRTKGDEYFNQLRCPTNFDLPKAAWRDVHFFEVSTLPRERVARVDVCSDHRIVISRRASYLLKQSALLQYGSSHIIYLLFTDPVLPHLKDSW